MKRNRVLALILCFMLSLSCVQPVFAEELVQVTEVTQAVEETKTAEETARETEAVEETETTALSDEKLEGEENVQQEDSELSSEEQNTVKLSEVEKVSSDWIAEDFTYAPYEKLLYGCDYTRQITIKGTAIAGFSKSGEEKLLQNKDLVIPAKDDKGNTIVGIANEAFKGKGLTSVTFPEGMSVDYDDTVTHVVTKRGNFVIGDAAFANNNLTSVVLPEGVIACLPNSFQNNKLTSVKFPKTIWWIENLAFANNRLEKVNLPRTCDFLLEIHGMTFANNFIKSVRLPDFTEVVNKTVFFQNLGMEPIVNAPNENYKTYVVDGKTYNAGIVYMYTDNAGLANKDRIHHAGKETASQQSFVQKLVVNDGTPESQNPDQEWNISDFVIEGTVIKGLTESGIAKRAKNKDLVLPNCNATGQPITEIAAGQAGGFGVFASETEKFRSVYLPPFLVKVGDCAFLNSGLEEVTYPSNLKEIGIQAFSGNQLKSVVLPDTVTTLGGGAFSTNPKLERIVLSKGLTEIPGGAFGCSDKKNRMENLRNIELHEGITKIGSNAFAGNNFTSIEIPSTVKKIDRFAFSTKEYFTDPCTLVLHEGLEEIGSWAFRNKVITEVKLPKTVKKLDEKAFEKTYSSGEAGVVTKIFVESKAQYDDNKNLPDSDYHKLILTDTSVWTAEDFTYGEEDFELYPASESGNKLVVKAHIVTGLSEYGEGKLLVNKNLVIPAKDSKGKKVQGVGNSAFKKKGIESLVLPVVEKVTYDDTQWETTGKGNKERGDFFIGASAFLGNQLKNLELPEGLIYVGGSAFSSNKLNMLTLPKSIMMVASQAFAKNEIISLQFPEKTDFAFQADNMAFAINKICAVQLPANTEKITKWAFLRNIGMEPVTTGNTNEKKGGIVHMYKSEPGGEFINHVDAGTSNVQKLIVGQIPASLSPWGVNDFTYNEAGNVITGLSDVGKEKIQKNSILALPKEGPTGKAITELGNGVSTKGIFVYETVDKAYAPSSVTLPSTLTKIGDFAFALNMKKTYENAEMKEITFPEGLQEIGKTAFQFNKLEKVVLPDSVKTLGVAAFSGNQKLTSVKLSSDMKEVPQSAFNASPYTDVKIKEMVIPEGIEKIGKQAFAGTHVETVKLPSTVKVIEDSAFRNHQLSTLTIPGGTIGKYAFKVDQQGIPTTLKTLVLQEGVTEIGKESFFGSLVTEVELPSTIDASKLKAGTAIFGTKKAPKNPAVLLKTSDKQLAEKYANDPAKAYSHEFVYDKLAGTGWAAGDFTYDEATAAITGWSESGKEKAKTNKTLVLPDQTPAGKDVVAIGDKAFEITEGVKETKFGYESPNGMTSVSLPAKLEKIGTKAFIFNAFTEVDFTGIKEIGQEAFKGNQLTKAELPDTVTVLGQGVFAANAITSVRIPKNETLTVIPEGLFSMNIRLEQVEIPDTIKEIGQTAFAGARLTSLVIPKSVTKIGEKAFHLHHLTELTIPGNVKEIGASAFEGTYKATTLKNLTLEEGIESIGKYAFKEALLETVHFPNSVKIVGEEPFENNKGKEGSHVVEVTTRNKAHLAFGGKTYKVNYLLEASKDEAVLQQTEFEFTGQELKPEVKIDGLVQGEHFEVAYKNNVNAGTAIVEIKGIGNCVGTITKQFEIKTKELANMGEAVKLSYDTIEYSGKENKPVVTIEGLEEGKDFEVVYKNNVNVGKATVEITGIRNYTGTITKEFTITEKKEDPNKPGVNPDKPGVNLDKPGTGTQQNKPVQKPVQNSENTSPKTSDVAPVKTLTFTLVFAAAIIVFAMDRKRKMN